MILRRTVYAVQLLVPFVMPWIFFPGRLALGAPAGWLSGFGFLMLGPLMTIAVGLPVLLSLRDRTSYRARAAGRPYTLATLVMWGALLLSAVFVTEDEASPPASLLVVWTGGAIDVVTSQYLFFLSFVVAVGAWATAMWFAITTLIDARRAAL